MYNNDEQNHCCPKVCGNEHAACNISELKELIDVCVPVTIEPFVEVGKVTVSVIDEPCVQPIHCGNWNRNGLCKFLVTQKLCVQVPITFNAIAKADNGLSTDCCDNHCHEPHYC